MDRSLSDARALQNIPVRKYADLLVKANRSDSIRPALYTTCLPTMPLTHIPAELPVNTAARLMHHYFLPAAAFAAKQDPGVKPADNLQRITSLYAALTRLHLDNPNKLPLLYLDLERLRFAVTNYSGNDKDSLYPQALRNTLETYKNLSDAALAGAALCDYTFQENNTLQQKEQNRIQALAISREVQKRFPVQMAPGNVPPLSSRS